MKVCLIYLPHPFLVQPDAQAPLGLMYIASILEQNDIDVEIYNFSSKFTYEAAAKVPRADIYGITVTSLEIPQANRFAHLIKEEYNSSKIILGGPGTLAKDKVDWNVIDSVVIGDGELLIMDLIKDMPNIKKEYFGKYEMNIDNLPLPSRHLLKNNLGGNIFAYNRNYKGSGSTVIVTMRGCPYNCSFCSAPKLRDICSKVRYRSPKSIYNEIKHIIDTYDIRQFRFSDDMFTSNRKRVFEICDLIGDLDIVWRISCRVKPFDYDMAKIMFDSGCKEASFGIESFDNNVLNVLQKDTTDLDNAKALEICEDIGIKTRILFMIRTPGQTNKTISINKSWLEKVPYNIIACTSFVPIPGSDIWYNPDKYNIEILNRNLDDYNFYFFSSYGENKVKDIIKLKGRTLDEVNNETTLFREYLKSTGKVNKG